jgi:hypothetical protein
MRMIRWTSAIVAVSLVGVACSELVAPNTDLGLSVWADVSPAVVHLSDTATMVRVRVYAANFGSTALRIQSGGPPYVAAVDPTRGKGFAEQYRVAHGSDSLTAGPTKDWGWDTVYVFRRGSREYVETQIPVRQWRADGALPDTGTYTVRSYFNHREGAPAQFRIVP